MLRFYRFMVHALFRGPIPDFPEFTEDPAVHDEDGRRARTAAAQGNWHAAAELLARTGGDWEQRGNRVEILADAAATGGIWLQTWLESRPDDPDAVLVESAMLHHRAFRARGSASASKTSGEQFRGFHQLSARAAAAADRAMALAGPYDPVPWVRKMDTMFGNHRSRASFDEVYAEGRRRDPHHFALHLVAVMLSTQKWGGSHEQMFATARQASAAAPPGSGTVLLPLFAHYEYVLREFTWGDNRDKGRRAAKAYIRGPEVRQEVDALLVKWRAGAPAGARNDLCRQWAALYHCQLKQRAEAKAEFDAIGPAVSAASPWAWFYGGSEWGYLQGWLWANHL
ncbi:DUF4034 domain-containing protein [Actinoplanes sp. DH11]|uniref:DUF4034 domain-containing protein n=1 Tax=Actinoplanes sp. DH11 TaxID=2857011 RepID=UPI001E643477|nr:DUF4034 domain-containing protein [Actinoplanes sp. DH11]